MSRNEYYAKAAETLSSYQLIELALKEYISEALDYAKRRMPTTFVFLISGSDFRDAALEKLIGTFKKLNGNTTLHSELERIKVSRNELAHRSLAELIRHEGSPDFEQRVADTLQDLEGQDAAAFSLFVRVYDEIDLLREKIAANPP
jgi:hypothetical protein